MNRREKLTTLEEACHLIQDGMILAIGGYLNNNHPMALVREIVRRNIKHLYLVTCIAAGIEADLLIGAGCVDTIQAPFVGGEWLGFMPNFRKKAERGEIKIKEVDEHHTLCSLRAAAFDLPFLPTRVGLGTDLLQVNKDLKVFNDPIRGETLVAVPPIKPDVAILHAQRADAYGNVQHRGSVFLDPLMAQAANKVIVMVEEVVPLEVILADPKKTTIPSYIVDAVVRVPYGAHPCSSHGCYKLDEVYYREYLNAAKNEETYRTHLDHYIFNVSSHEEYLEKIGIKRLLGLSMN